MSGDFSKRITELRTTVGKRRISGSVVVDQVYAHYQHAHLEFHHPRGGKALYLQAPLMENYRRYLDYYAGTVLDDGGVRAMIHAVEDLAGIGGVFTFAPREFEDLRNSGHPSVTHDDRKIYDRSAHQHRLSEAELKVKSRLRYMGLPDRLKGWIWWHVQHHTEPPPRRH
jgi:hypothetical protein